MLIPRSVLHAARATGEHHRNLHTVFIQRKPECQPSLLATDGKIVVHATWEEPDPAIPESMGDPTPVPGFRAQVDGQALLDAQALVPKTHFRPVLTHLLLCETPNGDGKLQLAASTFDNTSRLEARNEHAEDKRFIDLSLIQETFGKTKGEKNFDAYKLLDAVKLLIDVTGLKRLSDNSSSAFFNKIPSVTFTVSEHGLSLHAKKDGIEASVYLMGLIIPK